MSAYRNIFYPSQKIKGQEYGICFQAFTFSHSGSFEAYLQVHLSPYEEKEGRTEDFSSQAESLHLALKDLLEKPEWNRGKMAFRRYFLSDIINQEESLKKFIECTPSGAVSIIGQPPLEKSKISLFVYLIDRSFEERDEAFLHNGYTHLWSTRLCDSKGEEEQQMRNTFLQYKQQLLRHEMNLASDCRRTWIFAQDIDNRYQGVVKGRRDLFQEEGLTSHTHFIASTGIEGRNQLAKSYVTMDGYAVKGLSEEQQQFLYASSHLNPTYEYGVTFERGVALQYGDRCHLLLSGTASIDNKGEVLHRGDVIKQFNRMMENLHALLAEGGASFERDVAMAILYLRDPADYEVVLSCMERYAHIPTQILWAPVCRPEWLVEMECIAVSEKQENRFPSF